MDTKHDSHREQYQEARRAFEELSIEDRVLFLLKESITTVADGIEQAGRTLAREMDSLFREMEKEVEEEEQDMPPPPAPTAPTPPPPPTKKKSTTTAKPSASSSTSSSSPSSASSTEMDEDPSTS